MLYVLLILPVSIVADLTLRGVSSAHGSHALHADPFHRNLRTTITPDDEVLQRNLWNGIALEYIQSNGFQSKVITYSLQGRFSKRGWAPRFGPLLNVPCLYCERKHEHEDTQYMKNFSIEKMKEKMIWRSRIGACLFYGQRPENSEPRSLSEVTTLYSCIAGTKYRTIWQLWPSERTWQQSTPTKPGQEIPSCFAEQNYYCLSYTQPKCCWLNPILGNNPSLWQTNGLRYFKNMSRAMAQTCADYGDTVYLMIDDLEMVNEQYDWARKLGTPSIWKDDELVELQRLYSNGRIKKAIAIRYSDKTEHDKTKELFESVKTKRRSVEEERALRANAIMVKEHMAIKAELVMSGEHDRLTAESLDKRNLLCSEAWREQGFREDWFG